MSLVSTGIIKIGSDCHCSLKRLSLQFIPTHPLSLNMNHYNLPVSISPTTKCYKWMRKIITLNIPFLSSHFRNSNSDNKSSQLLLWKQSENICTMQSAAWENEAKVHKMLSDKRLWKIKEKQENECKSDQPPFQPLEPREKSFHARYAWCYWNFKCSCLTQFGAAWLKRTSHLTFKRHHLDRLKI